MSEGFTCVSKANEVQLNTHTSNVGGAHVGSIHERNAVHGSHGNNKTTINTPYDAPLLFRSKAMILILLGTDLARSLV